MDSIAELMHENKLYTVREFFLNEILKISGEIIQNDLMRYAITEQEINVIFSKSKSNQK